MYCTHCVQINVEVNAIKIKYINNSTNCPVATPKSTSKNILNIHLLFSNDKEPKERLAHKKNMILFFSNKLGPP